MEVARNWQPGQGWKRNLVAVEPMGKRTFTGDQRKPRQKASAPRRNKTNLADSAIVPPKKSHLLSQMAFWDNPKLF
jgi:hypothetical protein